MTSTKWTEEELKILRESYPIGGSKYTWNLLTAAGFHRSVKAVAATAKRYQITTGRNGRFKKGHIPINKGKGMSKELRERVKHTWFTKGHLPANTLFDGAVSKRKDNRGVFNYHIRISKGKWEYLSRFLWRQNYGEIPKGMIITYIDGDPMNCVIDNLEMITRQENLQRRQSQAAGHPAQVLADGYVRGVLKRLGIHPKAITKEMIETKKLQLKLQRQILEHESS